MAETGMKFDETPDEPEDKEDEKKTKKGKKAKVEEIDPEEIERRQAEIAKAADIAKYGVSVNLTNNCRERGFGRTSMRTMKRTRRSGLMEPMRSVKLTHM